MLPEWRAGGPGLGAGGEGGDGGLKGGSGFVPLLPEMHWWQRVANAPAGRAPCSQQPRPTLPELSVHVQHAGVSWHHLQHASTVLVLGSWARGSFLLPFEKVQPSTVEHCCTDRGAVDSSISGSMNPSIGTIIDAKIGAILDGKIACACDARS